MQATYGVNETVVYSDESEIILSCSRGEIGMCESIAGSSATLAYIGPCSTMCKERFLGERKFA
jgi:hypothetical protein